MSVKLLSTTGVALIGTLAISPVLAEDAYLGLSAGESQLEDVCDDVEGTVIGADCDDTDTAGKVFGGWKLADWFGLEAAYVDLGTAEIDAPGTSVDLDADGFSLSGVGFLPLSDNFDLFAKAGAYTWDVEASGVAGTLDDDGTDATYGVGARVGLNDNVALRAELERYEIDDYDVDVASVGVEFMW